MKSPKCSYKLNNNNKMDEMGVPEVEGEVGGVEVGRRQSPRRQTGNAGEGRRKTGVKKKEKESLFNS